MIAYKTGKVIADNFTPLVSKELTEMEIKEGISLRAYNAIITVLTVVIMVLVGLYINGYNSVMAGEDQELINAISKSPYALTAAFIAIVAGYLTGALGVNPLISIINIFQYNIQLRLSLTKAVKNTA